MGVPSQSSSLVNIRRNGFNPSVIYDIGAYTGLWTEEVIQIFPGASFFLFEAQENKSTALQQLKEQYADKVNFCISVLGADEEKQVAFHEYETASSVLEEHHDTEATTRKVVLSRLDNIVAKNNWPLPDFIKLDTQGYELEILKGGGQALAHAEAVLMEVSFIDIYMNAPLACDVINFMDNDGFSIYDICTLMRRPLDNALFQADILFVRKTSGILASKRWR